MGDDWDEIRRLAADLQRAQLSGSLQRLSENNCIEIVTKLMGLNLLDVVYTADGKEYITPQHLQRYIFTSRIFLSLKSFICLLFDAMFSWYISNFREIKDEMYVSRGRVSLVDLANTLNVDFSHVEHQVWL